MRASDIPVKFINHIGAWLCPTCFSRDLVSPGGGLVLLRSDASILHGYVRAWCQWCRHRSQPIPIETLHPGSYLLPDGPESRPILSLLQGGQRT
jgi:hypothetical protein